MKSKISIMAALLCAVTAATVQAQENSSSAAASFTTLTVDARTAAMGGASTALNSGAWATTNNSAASVFEKQQAAVGYSYLPWQRDIRQSSQLNAAAGYFKIDSKNALNIGYRHFSSGNYDATDDMGNTLGVVSPKEWALEVGYSRWLIEGLAVGVTARIVRSDLKTGSAANAVAFDLSALYRKSLNLMDGAWWSVGVVASNFGTKLKYDNTGYSMPGVLKGGASVCLPFTADHQLSVAADVIGTVVPSTDRSCQAALGAEYTYKQMVSLRGGYHSGNKSSGPGDYFTVGAGVSVWAIDLSGAYYLANKNTNPIHNTWMLTIGVGLDKIVGKKY